MMARTVVVFVMVQIVPHAGAVAKRNLHGLFAGRDLSLNHRDIPSVRIGANYALVKRQGLTVGIQDRVAPASFGPSIFGFANPVGIRASGLWTRR